MSVCKQTVYNPESKRCIVVGGRTHQKLIAEGKMTAAQTIKEVTREAIVAQKSPVKMASPKKVSPKKDVKKRGRPAGAKNIKKGEKKLSPKKKLSPVKERPVSPKRVKKSPKKVSPKKPRTKRVAVAK